MPQGLMFFPPITALPPPPKGPPLTLVDLFFPNPVASWACSLLHSLETGLVLLPDFLFLFHTRTATAPDIPLPFLLI